MRYLALVFSLLFYLPVSAQLLFKKPQSTPTTEQQMNSEMRDATAILEGFDKALNDIKNKKGTDSQPLLNDFLKQRFENGVGGRGGGQGVMTANGQFRLLDLVPPGTKLSTQGILQEKPCTYGAGDLVAFEIGSPVLKILEANIDRMTEGSHIARLALRAHLSTLLSKARQFRSYPLNSIQAWRDGKRFSPEYQHPIAIFNSTFLLIHKPSYDRLPETDRAALILHELMRQISIDLRASSDQSYTGVQLAALEDFIYEIFTLQRFDRINHYLPITVSQHLGQEILDVANEGRNLILEIGARGAHGDYQSYLNKIDKFNQRFRSQPETQHALDLLHASHPDLSRALTGIKDASGFLAKKYNPQMLPAAREFQYYIVKSHMRHWATVTTSSIPGFLLIHARLNHLACEGLDQLLQIPPDRNRQ